VPTPETTASWTADHHHDSAGQTAPVEIYFVIGGDRLPVARRLPVLVPDRTAQVARVSSRRDRRPTSGVGAPHRAAQPHEDETADGIATWTSGGSVLNRTISTRDQNLAIAQLVLTVGRLQGVGQVRHDSTAIPPRSRCRPPTR
jgi:hypothetical protein